MSYCHTFLQKKGVEKLSVAEQPRHAKWETNLASCLAEEPSGDELEGVQEAG